MNLERKFKLGTGGYMINSWDDCNDNWTPYSVKDVKSEDTQTIDPKLSCISDLEARLHRLNIETTEVALELAKKQNLPIGMVCLKSEPAEQLTSTTIGNRDSSSSEYGYGKNYKTGAISKTTTSEYQHQNTQLKSKPHVASKGSSGKNYNNWEYPQNYQYQDAQMTWSQANPYQGYGKNGKGGSPRAGKGGKSGSPRAVKRPNSFAGTMPCWYGYNCTNTSCGYIH